MQPPSALPPDSFWSGFKITDVIIAISAFLASVFACLQWLVYRRQADIAEGTRKLAEAALDRPYILVDAMSARFEAGSENFLAHFDFRLRNYGKGPAIIRHIVAHGFLSSGEQGRRARDDYPSRLFPRPDELAGLLGDRPSVRVFPEVRPDVLSFEPFEMGLRIRQSAIVLRSGEESPEFSHFAKDIHLRTSDNLPSMYEKMPPWLIGRITYLDVFDMEHITQFCFRVRSDGIAEEYGDAPYNQRT